MGMRYFTKQNRALITELVRTDFKLRYQGSVLGYAWSLLRPLLLFVILYIVFVNFLKVGTGVPHFPVYLLLGIVVWNFFNEMTTLSIDSIVRRGDLIRKIGIPKWIIIFSSSISSLINLALNLLVVGIFLFINHVNLLSSILWLPLILVEVYILALGVSLLLSAAFVKYRDVNYIWEVLMQAGFYMTPIIYPISRITNVKLQEFIMINPMAQAIQDSRYAVVTHQSMTVYQVFGGGWYKFIPFTIVLVIFVVGLQYFRKESKYFAENI
ncbi:MAG: Transport permease protein [Candidatus Saccharibacteria bacterium]|nr:Transport permease protein [Candidatus Saccharibacteria bacterium]